MMSHSPTMGTNSSEIKAHNLSAILLTLLHHENVSRMYLAGVLGVSNATITNLVNELMERGYVAEAGVLRTNGQAGRPQRVLELVWDARYAIGVHIDVGKVHIALANLNGQLLRKETFQHQIQTASEDVLTQIVEHVNAVIQESAIVRENIVGLGVAASGLVNIDTGVNVIAPNLHWFDVPIRDVLQEQLQLPVVVDNNVRAMAFGEAMFGTARNVKSMAFIYGRIGVGAGLVVDGRLYRGAAAGAGEIGHSVVMVPTYREGGVITATLESLVSEKAILAQARALARANRQSPLAQLSDVHEMTMELLFEAARSGDADVCALLDERASYVGIALANLVNIFNPELIVLGGLFSRGHDVMLPAMKAALKRHAFANLGQQVQLRVTQFADEVGMVGSAAMALEAFFYHPQNYVASA